MILGSHLIILSSWAFCPAFSQRAPVVCALLISPHRGLPGSSPSVRVPGRVGLARRACALAKSQAPVAELEFLFGDLRAAGAPLGAEFIPSIVLDLGVLQG